MICLSVCPSVAAGQGRDATTQHSAAVATCESLPALAAGPLLCIPGSHYQMAWQQGGWVVDGWWMGGSSCVFPHTSPARATGIQPAERRGHAARDVNMDGHEGRGWTWMPTGQWTDGPWKKAGTVGHPVRPHPQHPAHAVHSTTGFAMAQIAETAARTARRCRVHNVQYRVEALES